MWIRSQNKTDLVDTKRISILQDHTRFRVAALYQGTSDDYDHLGWYETKARAIEVLGYIQQQLIEVSSSDSTYDDGQTINHYEVVYEMPKE